jgi:hypothetical protein
MPSLNVERPCRDLERKYLPKLNLISRHTSAYEDRKWDSHVQDKGEFPRLLHKLTIKLPPLEKRQQQQQQEHQRQPIPQKQKQTDKQNRIKPHQHQEQQQSQLIIQPPSKTMKLRANGSKHYPVLVKELDHRGRNLWSPTSNGSWEYTTMKTEVNRVLQEELHSICKQRQRSSPKPMPTCMKLPQVKPIFFHVQVRDTTRTGGHSNSYRYVEFPILMSQVQAITEQVQNVEHHYLLHKPEKTKKDASVI